MQLILKLRQLTLTTDLSSLHYHDSKQRVAQAEDQLSDVHCPLEPQVVLAQTVVEKAILVFLQTFKY